VKLHSFSSLVVVAVLAGGSAGCSSEFVQDQGRSPSQLVINTLVGVPGDAPSQKSNTMISDVETLVTEPEPQCTTENPCRTWLNDAGEATFSILLKDAGSATSTGPSVINSITLTRYHVEYKRSDGRNTQGVDVPYAFDSAVTVTVPSTGSATVAFDLVRNNAKKERPLISLICTTSCPPMISTIAEVTFYGRDQAGNDVAAKGTLGVTFGDIVRSK